MFNILVCEDDINMCKLICTYLKKSEYSVFQSENGKKALEVFEESKIDLLITDVMMPDMDGYELVQTLRESGYDIPVLMITAKETLEDKRKGFSLGVDDYMTKPADMDEMLLRVQALLRRYKSVSNRKIIMGNTVMDYDDFTVKYGDVQAALPKKEFQLLFLLASNINHIYTRTQIFEEIWGYDATSDERTIDVHIKRLRERFADNTDFEIITVRGLGYKAAVK